MKKQTIKEIVRWHTFKAGYLQTMREELCRDNVHDTYGVGFHQCSRKAKLFIRGVGFCRQHAIQLNADLVAYVWFR